MTEKRKNRARLQFLECSSEQTKNNTDIDIQAESDEEMDATSDQSHEKRKSESPIKNFSPKKAKENKVKQ